MLMTGNTICMDPDRFDSTGTNINSELSDCTIFAADGKCL